MGFVSQISFSLKPVPPFRLDYTVWVLRRRPDNIWDRWDGQTYRRVLVLGESPLEVAVVQAGSPEKPELKITATGSRLPAGLESPLTVTLERLLGLKTDLKGFYRLAMKDPRLKPLAFQFRGMKPPHYPAVFEALVNAITCQQFTLTAGIRLLGSLVTGWGKPYPSSSSTFHAFPRPQDLAHLEVEDLRKLGYSRQKARSLVDLSREVVEGGLDLEELASLEDSKVMERLIQLGGVGRWTAEYTLLRGLGRIHIFPGDDVGVRNRLQSWMRVTKPLTYEGVRRILNRWKPYGGLIYFHLLLKGLSEAGQLTIADCGVRNAP
jgi:DNA-3-methyladenine glycosylase II